MGDAFTELASHPGAPPDAVTEHWQTAREMYQHSLEIMQQLRDGGALDASELKEIDEVTGKLANCEAKLK